MRMSGESVGKPTQRRRLRMRLAKSPIRLETILYADWRSKLFPSKPKPVRIRVVRRAYTDESRAAL